MAVLVAVLYAFSRLMTDNELTALKANGVSLGALMRPLLIAASGVAVVAFLFLYLLAALEELGKILVAVLPALDDNPDELPNVPQGYR